jgi:hypothetical protein
MKRHPILPSQKVAHANGAIFYGNGKIDGRDLVTPATREHERAAPRLVSGTWRRAVAQMVQNAHSGTSHAAHELPFVVY